MNQGVEIMLKRMDSHPEEFPMDLTREWTGSEGKWQPITRMIYMRMRQLDPNAGVDNSVAGTTAMPYLTDDEVRALYDKLMSIQAEAFTKAVLETMLRDPEYPEEGMAGAPDTTPVPTQRVPWPHRTALGSAPIKLEGKKVLY